MNFFIKSVRLYFYGSKYQEYIFEPNKINVITGDSGTGKTSILSIIDYCLMAQKDNIPHDIQQKVTWFLISFEINGKVWNVARKSPRGGMSGEIYFNEVDIDEKLYPNISVEDFRKKIDNELKIKNIFSYPLDQNYQDSNFVISYRDFLLFNALTESVIGAKDKYWDTEFFGNENFIGKLNTLFQLAIGLNSLEGVKAEEKLKIIKKEIEKIEKIEKNDKNSAEKYNKQVDILFEKCQLEGVLKNIDQSQGKLNSISLGIERLKSLILSNDYYSEIEYLEERKSQVNFELKILEKYKKQYNEYKKNLEKNADSLAPVEYLKSKFDEQILKTFETSDFILELDSSLKKIREKSKELVRDYDFSDDNYILLKEEQKEINKRTKELTEIQSEINYLNTKAFRLGELSLEYSNLSKSEKKRKNKLVDSDIKNEILNYQEALNEIVEKYIDKFKITNNLNESIQENFDCIQTMNNYKNYKTIFDIDEMKLLLYPDSNQFDFPIINVGSKSNYMFLHLCTFLGFHEHFLSRVNSFVLNFLFIDQPSIPYYYGDSRSKDDKRKLIDAFSLINSFMGRILEEKNFQIILIEHAPRSYWEENKLKYFHVVSEFVNGKALIPQDIFGK
ncbi:DUF3732 domain-containing protein [Acinetobacter baumannii]